MVEIRALDEADWPSWRELWEGYLDFYRAELDEETTRASFRRLVAGEDLFGLAAVEAGRFQGIAHCVLHPSTWAQEPTCYLEDLYVLPSARGTGVGYQLLKAVGSAAHRRGAARVYWHTQVFNGAARSLYDQVARPTSFMVYEMRPRPT
jgi:GNAT superfamily N-acetyltransferase